MKITVLASGSGGNATYVETAHTKLLIDCGITYRQVVQRLATKERTLDDLDAVLITHEHTDHVKGIDVLLRRHQTTLYLTESTFQSLHSKVRENIDLSKVQFITPYEDVQLNDVRIMPLSISHDASDAVGYILYAEGKKIVYITDIGYLPKQDQEPLRHADCYIFESNYDVTMLFTSARPFYLKQRIDSVKGHMSNMDSAYNLAQLVGTNTTHIILAHRSRECNTDELVLQTYRDVFSDYGLHLEQYKVVIAKQDIPTTLFHI